MSVQHTTSRIRRGKRQAIREFFRSRIALPVPSSECHSKVGSSFRSRVAELNADVDGDLIIINKTHPGCHSEISFYTAYRREPVPTLFPDLRQEMRDDG